MKPTPPSAAATTAPIEAGPPEARHWEAFTEAMNALSPLSEADLHPARAACRLVTLQKGEPLLRAGERAHLVGFVATGGLREFYVLPNGDERTKGFSLPGWFAGSLSDLISHDVSKVWIEAAAPTVLLTLPWADYRHWVSTQLAWTRFAHQVAERLYMMKVEREYELLALDAGARLQATLARWPTLEQVFSQRDIASYVGVTPVHLSRLRGARARSPGPGSPG